MQDDLWLVCLNWRYGSANISTAERERNTYDYIKLKGSDFIITTINMS